MYERKFGEGRLLGDKAIWAGWERVLERVLLATLASLFAILPHLASMCLAQEQELLPSEVHIYVWPEHVADVETPIRFEWTHPGGRAEKFAGDLSSKIEILQTAETPTDPFPSDGATNIPVDTDFSWDDHNAYLRWGESFTLRLWLNDREEEYSFPTERPPGKIPLILEPSTTYQWQVQTSNGTGPVWSFTTAEKGPVTSLSELSVIGEELRISWMDPSWLQVSGTDVNADGLADLFFGAPYYQESIEICMYPFPYPYYFTYYRGLFGLLYSKLSSFYDPREALDWSQLDLSVEGKIQGGFCHNNFYIEQLGRYLTPLGDLNNDGFGDFSLKGVNGEQEYILLGGALPWN